MHEIHKIQPNGGEKFASFTNGVPGVDINGDTSVYLKKLKEVNRQWSLKALRLPPIEQSTRSAQEEIEKNRKKDTKTLTEKSKQRINSEIISKQSTNAKKFEKEDLESNFPLIDVYDTEEEPTQTLNSTIETPQEFTILVEESQVSDEVEVSQISEEHYTIVIKDKNNYRILNSTEKEEEEQAQKVNSFQSKPHLLNGFYKPLPQSKNSTLKRTYPDYFEKKHSKHIPKKFKRLINYTSASSESSDEDTESESDSDFDDRSLKELLKSLTKNLNKKRRKSPMGILSKLREFFNFKKSDIQETPYRKRRITEQSSNSDYSPQIKYRRVENKFPKYVESTLEDDESNLMFTNNSQRDPAKFNNSIMNEQNQAKLRNSLFAVPKTTRKLIRRSAFVNVELPDDEDVIEIKRPENVATTQPTTQRLTYAQVLQQNMFNQNNIKKHENSKILGKGYVLGTRTTSHNLPTNVASTSTARNLKSAMLPCPFSTQRRSMLQEQKQREDHNNYKKLLQRVQNAGFGRENTAPDIRPACTNNSFDSYSSRRSLSINGVKSKQPVRVETLNKSIDLTDDDDDDDLEFTGILASSSMNQIKSKKVPIIDLEHERDDDDICEVIDLEAEPQTSQTSLAKNTSKTLKLPLVEQVNTLFDRIHSTPAVSDNWILEMKSKYLEQKKTREHSLAEFEKLTSQLEKERCAAELEIQQRLRSFQIIDPACFVVDEFPESDLEDETEPRLVPLTEEHHNIIQRSLQGPPDQVLVNKFNLSITRRDIQTLQGLNWLNDEVINFYMNLLTERSEKTKCLPSVYAMNTFFVQRLLQNGHGGVKRWTRKVDIFSKDLIPVPVHVGGVHWCMAIINLKEKSIKYYDSMGSPNPTVLRALAQYLRDESMDKRKKPYDTSKFHIESVEDVPRQMNGSDCGVFSCMFAEFVTRNRSITFSQQHMEYFRYKMIVEIVKGELLQ